MKKETKIELEYADGMRSITKEYIEKRIALQNKGKGIVVENMATVDDEMETHLKAYYRKYADKIAELKKG